MIKQAMVQCDFIKLAWKHIKMKRLCLDKKSDSGSLISSVSVSVPVRISFLVLGIFQQSLKMQLMILMKTKIRQTQMNG
jgi:hypothetical protein